MPSICLSATTLNTGLRAVHALTHRILPRPMMNWLRVFPSLITAHRFLGALTTPKGSRPSRSSSPHSLVQRLGRVAAGVVLAVGIGLSPMLVSSAFAQTASQSSPEAKEATGPAHWPARFDRQIAHALTREPSMRASHIQTAIEAAVETEALDLSRTVRALLDVIEHDMNQNHRLMAVQALHHIGPEHVGKKQYRQAMSRLYTLTQGALPAPVRVAAQRTLAHFARTG